MAQRELDIVAEARVTLNDGDPNGERWTTERLLKLLDDGQKSMCRELSFIVRKSPLQTSAGQEEYSTPEGCIILMSATAGGRTLEFTSFEELDRVNPDWENDTASKYTHIVVNKLSQNTIRPYPRLTGEAEADASRINLRYSVLPDSLGYVEPTGGLPTGDTVNQLQIASLWDYGLTQYVIGNAFIDYGDAGSTSRAGVALNNFATQLSRASQIISRKARRITTTAYQGGVASSNHTLGSRS